MKLSITKILLLATIVVLCVVAYLLYTGPSKVVVAQKFYRVDVKANDSTCVSTFIVEPNPDPLRFGYDWPLYYIGDPQDAVITLTPDNKSICVTNTNMTSPMVVGLIDKTWYDARWGDCIAWQAVENQATQSITQEIFYCIQFRTQNQTLAMGCQVACEKYFAADTDPWRECREACYTSIVAHFGI